MRNIVRGSIACSFWMVVSAVFFSDAVHAQACLHNGMMVDPCPDRSRVQPRPAALQTVPSVEVQNSILCDIGRATVAAAPRDRDPMKQVVTGSMSLKQAVTNTSTGTLGVEGILLVPARAELGLSGAGSHGVTVTNTATLPFAAPVSVLLESCKLVRPRTNSHHRWLTAYRQQVNAIWLNRTPIKKAVLENSVEVTNTTKSGFVLSFVITIGATHAYSHATTQSIKIEGDFGDPKPDIWQ